MSSLAEAATLATSMLSPGASDLPVACEIINIGKHSLHYTTRIFIVVQGTFSLDTTYTGTLDPGQMSQVFATVSNAARCEFDVSTPKSVRAAAKQLDSNYSTKVVGEAR